MDLSVGVIELAIKMTERLVELHGKADKIR